jgi:uncharacterized protein YlxW (UPF0749 family)
VSIERERIEEERHELEQSVSNMTMQLNSDINTLQKEIEDLKRFTESFEKDDANNKIDELLEKLTQFKQIKEIINRDIMILQMG